VSSKEIAHGDRSCNAGDVDEQIAVILEAVERCIQVNRQIGVSTEGELGRHAQVLAAAQRKSSGDGVVGCSDQSGSRPSPEVSCKGED
jgi:hypothetical protein